MSDEQESMSVVKDIYKTFQEGRVEPHSFLVGQMNKNMQEV